MPSIYHTRQPQKCKYCDLPAKRNIQPGNRNKGYYRTCGSEKCTTEQYRDKAVSARKAANILKNCQKCATTYISASPCQRWCANCVPTKAHRGIMQRYNLSYDEYREILALHDGKCAICLDRKAKVIDHDHATGKVRGGLCGACNMALHLIEDRQSLRRALSYIGAEL